MEEGLARIRMAVQNTGWLPTNVTKIALEKNLCRGVVGEVARAGDTGETAGKPAPEWLVGGTLRAEAGQLAGWSHVPAGGFGWQMNGTDDVHVFEWVVRGKGEYSLTARHERAGVVRSVVRV